MRRKKNRKVRKLFPQSFPLKLFLSLPETRERRTNARETTRNYTTTLRDTERLQREREREMSAPATTKGPSSSSLGEKRLLKIKVRSQDPVGEYEFSLCATVRYVVLTRKRSFLFSALRSSLVFLFLFFFFVLYSHSRALGKEISFLQFSRNASRRE